MAAGDIGSLKAARAPLASERDLATLLVIVLVVSTMAKLVLIHVGAVIWEEAHFAVSGRRLDLAYTDVPAGWPLLARGLTTLFGENAWALRLPALAIAQASPLAVFWLAEPLVGRRQALWAALIAAVLPPLAISGTIYYPEAALQLCLAIALGGGVRAFADGRLAWWLVAGAAAGLGAFIHYRFGLALLGAGLFLVVTKQGRRRLTQPGPWAGLALIGAGIAPSLIYNVREGWPALGFHLVDRQVWDVNAEGLALFLAEQALIASPVMLAGFFGAGWIAWRRWLAGEAGAGLCLFVAGGVFLTLALLSPLYRTRLPHWPFPAYPALIAFMPAAFIAFADAARGSAARLARMGVIALAPGLALVVLMSASAFHLAAAFPQIMPVGWRHLLQSELEDWTALRPLIAEAAASAEARFGGEAAFVGAGHLTALRLEFPDAAGRDVYALATPFDAKARFAAMRAHWRLDDGALYADKAGAPVVLVLPAPHYLYHAPDDVAFRKRLCANIADLSPQAHFEPPPGRLLVEVFIGRVAPGAGQASGCALFDPIYLARPKRGQRVRRGAGAQFYGMAADRAGVERVEILLDGAKVADAVAHIDERASPAPDVLAFDPDFPAIQFAFRLPKDIAPGVRRLSVRAVLRDGHTREGAARTIYVTD